MIGEGKLLFSSNKHTLMRLLDEEAPVVTKIIGADWSSILQLVRRGARKLIVVVTEDVCSDTDQWDFTVGMHLGG